MPALANVQYGARVEMKWQTGSSPMGGVRLFFQYSPANPPAADLQTWVNHISQQWGAWMAPLQHQNQSLVSVVAVDLNNANGNEAAWTGSVAGGRSGSELPVDNAVLVNYQIGTRYRGGKPRTYWPLGVDTDVANGRSWSGAFQTTFNTAFGDFLNGIVGHFGGTIFGPQLCVHYYKGHEQNTTGSIWDPAYKPLPYPPGTNAPTDLVLGWTMALPISSQRRRLKVSGS